MKHLGLLGGTVAVTVGLAAGGAEAGIGAYLATSTTTTTIPSSSGSYVIVESITVPAGFYTIVANAQVQYTGLGYAVPNCTIFEGSSTLPGSGGQVTLGGNFAFGSEAAVSAYHATATTTISLQCEQYTNVTGITVQPGANLLITKASGAIILS